GLGCVFELARTRAGYHEHVLYSFAGGNDGSSPTSTLLAAGSHTLYGTTSMGGSSCDCGTVFKLNAKTGAEQVVHAFSGGQDGAYPYYGLTRDTSGNLYGTTAVGGTSNKGVVFEVTP
ncbi:MAG TPA: choice-of-anchor tandem repeat GloVer-containing protein, partial [Candidatus Cybelea sp.]|nr:choice-of-anchor tandem repeat GloVer-containing protein [Candidatus Cybelea sp.]